MKKNNALRVAALLLALTLITTCFVGGTFAKYITEVSSEDSARVAYWGFDEAVSMDIDGLFATAYTGDSGMNADVDAIAPGTTNSATFQFKYDEVGADAPEVAYTFTVDTTGSEIAEDLVANTNIQWKLDENEWGTFADMLADIKALSGDASGTKSYGPNVLPDEFAANDTVHTISWQWIFNDVASATDAQNVKDTALGNKNTLDTVKVVIKITAAQDDTSNAA